MPRAPRVVTETFVSTETSLVKGAPFSAEAVNESVQTLADGNRIVRKWSNKLFRNGEGRLRREGSSGSGSLLGAYLTGDSAISIIDPAGGRLFLDSNLKTARVIATPSITARVEGQSPIIVNGMSPEKSQAELKAAGVIGVTTLVPGKSAGSPAAESVRAAAVERLAATAVSVGQAPLVAYGYSTSSAKYDVKTESLGTQNFEGVNAEGTRTTTTIPAEAIGNERPIEIVYEKWYSKELQVTVYSRHYDPRFGEHVYRLTNINRSEPDPSLFEVPAGYKVISDPRTTLYRPVAPRAVTERTAPTRVYTPTTGTKP